MRSAEAEALPERHSSVPYSVFKELESFRSLQGQSSKGLPECQADFQAFFLKRQGVFDLNEDTLFREPMSEMAEFLRYS